MTTYSMADRSQLLKLAKWLMDEETLQLKAYPDMGGYSIGYGHFGAKRGDTCTTAQAEVWLWEDIAKAVDGVATLCSVHGVDVDGARWAALVAMAFQMGYGQKGLGGFRQMWDLLHGGYWAEAAIEAMDGSRPGATSRWVDQTPARAVRTVLAIAQNEWPASAL